MSGSTKYRLAWVTVPEGLLDYGHGQNARKARSKNKDIDRRIKRREHAVITAEALREYEEDQALNILDTIDYSSEDDWYNEHQFDEEYNDYDLQLQAEDNRSHYYDDYDPYYEDLDYSYASGSLTERGLTSMEHTAYTIQSGKSLWNAFRRNQP